jgi:amylosucrase
MQAHSIFLGGIPMLFYGDEAGYTNDYSYLEDVAKSYDNRWMHRPVIDWEKNKRVNEAGTVENSVFAGTRRLISIRRMLPEVADHKNLTWINCNNNHIAAYLRNNGSKQLYGVYNFSTEKVVVPVAPFKVAARNTGDFYDYWSEKSVSTGKQGHLAIDAYSFLLLKPEY